MTRDDARGGATFTVEPTAHHGVRSRFIREGGGNDNAINHQIIITSDAN